MKHFKKLAVKYTVAAAAFAPLAAFADAADPLAAAQSQIATWTPIVGTLCVAAFGIAVLFKGLGLGKKGIDKL